MPEPETPLVIVTGAGRVVRGAGTAALVVATMLAGLASSAPVVFKGPWSALVLVATWAVLRNARNPHGGSLTLDVHGMGGFAVPGRPAQRVRLGAGHWISSHISFIDFRCDGRASQLLLVLPGRQAPGEYRRMMARLRHAWPQQVN